MSHRYFLLTVLLILFSFVFLGCSSSSSSNPTAGNQSSPITGNWRCVARGFAPPSTSLIHILAMTDSMYFSITDSNTFVLTHTVGANTERYTGTIRYAPPRLIARCATVQNSGLTNGVTIAAGDSLVYYAAATTSSLDLRDTISLGGSPAPEYYGFLKVESDVKIGGIVIGSGVPVANAAIFGSSSTGASYSGTSSNTWGCFGASGMAVGTWTMRATSAGLTYNAPAGLPIVAPGVYVTTLSR